MVCIEIPRNNDHSGNMINRSETWATVGLRTSFFSTGGNIVGAERADTWWTSLTGEQPTEEIRKPREGVYDARGQFLGGLLQLQVQALRIDWNLIPQLPAEDQPINPFASIGSMEQVGQFLDHVTRWIPQIATQIGRIAFGAVFQQLVADKVSGYKVLGDYLHSIKLDAENSSDFSYQINRPRKSVMVQNLSINRLSKWSVAFSRPISFVVGPNNAIAASMEAGSAYAVRLELDVNTDANSTSALSHNHMIDILRELGSLGMEITSKGDVS